ncbi:helix-turn-helix domain-containing protein [Fulvivirga maritima]|uniref:helix-turn-helix domain-containing protein n=1 Tax=Fulvivirga maritima TaxID=2904247 RepID=UPI001F243D6C|nr:helix-turn-helix domain-containing protein [Fulvivirga maritima]UII25580.1 helix-turn-helix domain-containing protein [Fulvivirga maritima]
MKEKSEIHYFKSISQLLQELQLPAPNHPLIALVNYNGVKVQQLERGRKNCIDFYKISFKLSFKGQTKYGRGYYDFEEGGLAFLQPRQIVASPDNLGDYEGWALYFHPDFIRNYALGKMMNKYGFFAYDVSEALFLSAKEKEVISDLFNSIAKELSGNIDQYTQDVLVSQLELLLNYSNRFYNRQFITRKTVNNDIINKLDKLLDNYFNAGEGLHNGVPSVLHISEELQLSQRYLSDMIKSLTGLTTQQYIQNSMIERAKDKLSTTKLSVSQIAYDLGFEHSQSFSKLFRASTQLTPLQFRKSFD